MARKRQVSPEETATGYLKTVGLSETSEDRVFRWTIRRRRFCHNLVRNGGNGTKAALDAGYADGKEAWRLLGFAEVRKYIEIDVRNHLLAIDVTEESVLAKYANWSIGNVWDVLTYSNKSKTWRVSPKSKIPEEVQRRVKKLKIKATDHGQEIEVEMHDPMRANDKLAQVLGMFQPDAEQIRETAEELAQKFWRITQAMDTVDGLGTDSTEPGDAPGAVAPAQETPGTA